MKMKLRSPREQSESPSTLMRQTILMQIMVFWFIRVKGFSWLFFFFKHHHIGKTAWVICRIFLQRETWVIIFENTEIYQTKITFIFWCLDCWMDKLAHFKKSSWPLGDCNEHIWRDTTFWLMKGGKLKFLDANLNSNLELVIIFKGRWRKF